MDIMPFVNQWNGKFADWDHSYGNQCVDLISYFSEWLGLSHIPGNANQLKYNANPHDYSWIDNSPRAIPEAGDIVIFKIGQYGHVGIAMPGATTLSLMCFEQNYPVGSKCHQIAHPLYRNVVGWLRPKVKQTEPQTQTGGQTMPYNVDAGNQIRNNPALNQFMRLVVTRTLESARLAMFNHIDEQGLQADVDRWMNALYSGSDFEGKDILNAYFQSEEFKTHWQAKQ